MKTRKIPFRLPDVGLDEVKGTISMDEEFLVIEVKRSLFGEFDQEKEIVKIEPAALLDARLKIGIVRDQLILVPKTDQLAESLPGDFEGEVKLKIWKKYREGLVDLSARLQSAIPAAG